MQIICNEYRSNEILKMLREYADMTQTDFGMLINKSYKAIRLYEYGQRNYDCRYLLTILEKLNLKLIVKQENKILIEYNNLTQLSADMLLKILRKELNLTQSKLATSLNKKTDTIRAYENLRRNYDFELILKIANIYYLKVLIIS